MSKYQTLIDALEAPGLSDCPWVAFGPSNGAAPPDYYNEVVAVRGDAQVQVICHAPRGLGGACTADTNYIAEANPAAIRALLADLERAEKALAALAQQAQEPVGDRYFSYSTDMGFEEFATQQEAIDCSNVQINGYRDDAIRDDEWPDEVDSVCWGVILGRSKEIDTSNEDHESVDYKLHTTPPAPQVPAPVDEEIIAGVLFDFMGWLTSREKRIVLSSADFASPAVEAIREFAQMRGLDISKAAVRDWQARAALQSPAPKTKGQP